MNPLELALRLVATRQAGLTEPDRGLRKRMDQAFRDDLEVWSAWLQVHPEQTARLIGTFATEIAQSRIDLGLPVIPAPAWSVPADPPVTLDADPGLPPSLVALVDRLAAQLMLTADDWRLEVTAAGGTVTASPGAAS